MVTPTPTTVQVKIQLRSDTSTNWASVNPVLLAGEMGLETNTNRIKIGNGSTAWNSLGYFPFAVSGGTVTGNLEIGTTGTLTFEGSSADNFETTLGVINPTADRTINLPNVSGTIITTGDTGTVTSTMIADGTIVNADVSASAAIAHSKLANITAGYVLIGNASNVPTATQVTGDVTISDTGVTAISSGVIVDADIAANAEIAVSKLANGTANQVIVTDGTNVSWSDDLTLAGNLTVNGTTTTINTQDLLVEDKNIILGNVDTPTDVTADGGGITLKGATDKTINWVDATDAWTSSERFSVPLGSAASPSLTFTGDENTGIYSPGADQLALSTNGTGRLFIDSSGRVGVATVSPQALLDLSANSETGSNTLRFTDSDTLTVANQQIGKIEFYSADASTPGAGVKAYIGAFAEDTSPDAYLAFATDTATGTPTERLRITSAGLVGIGSSVPGTLLHLAGNNTGTTGDSPVATIRLEDTDGSTSDDQPIGKIEFYGNDSTTPAVGVQSYIISRAVSTSGGGYLEFGTRPNGGASADPRMRIDGSGRVGIGTTTVDSLLHLYSSSVGGVRLTLQDSGTGTTSSDGYIQGVDSSQNAYFFNRESSAMYFGTANTERLRITSDGLVSIGDSAPVATLTVKGGPSVDGTMFPSGNRLAHFDSNVGDTELITFGNQSLNASTFTMAFVPRRAGSVGAQHGWYQKIDSTSAAAGSYTLGTLQRASSGGAPETPRFHITSAGLVGIGTTSPAHQLVVGQNAWIGTGGGASTGVGTARTLTIGVNRTTTDVSPSIQLLKAHTSSTSVAGGFKIDLANAGVNLPELAFYAGTSTGNSSASFVEPTWGERLRIDSSGRLLVGTSSARTNFFNGTVTSPVQVESTTDAIYSATRNSNNIFGPGIVLAKSRGTSVGSNTLVQSGDSTGGIYFHGSDGTDFVETASITSAVDGTPGANDMPGRLVFATTADGASSPTERMRIDSAGNVGIGRTPVYALDIYKASGGSTVYNQSDSIADTEGVMFYARDNGRSRQAAVGVYKHSGITNSAGFIELEPQDGNNNYLWVDDSDQLRISTTSAHIGTTSGTIVGTQTSDERLKNILGPVEYGLDTLKQIETVRYSLKSEPETEKLGFIAQQVLPLLPQSVFDTGEHIEGEPEDAPTKLGMEYVALIPVLVNAIKELSTEVDALKAQLQ